MTFRETSEVFRSLVSAELEKESLKKQADIDLIREHLASQIRSQAAELETASKETHEKDALLTELEEFEKKIKASPALLNKFKQIKQALLQNPKLVDQVDSKFVDGIMIMDLGE